MRVSPTLASISAAPSGDAGSTPELAVVDGLLTGADQECLGVVLVTVVIDLHHGPGQRDARLLGCLADLGVVEQLLQLTDARLFLALLLSGGVVTAVLAEVALLATVVDLGGDDGAVGNQLVQLRLQPVV